MNKYLFQTSINLRTSTMFEHTYKLINKYLYQIGKNLQTSTISIIKIRSNGKKQNKKQLNSILQPVFFKVVQCKSNKKIDYI